METSFSELNGRIAYMRDGGLCMYCLYVRNRPGVRGSETDHVFGRGKQALHHWALRLTLCHECHYQKHHGKDGWFKRDVEANVLFLANSNPQFENWNARQIEAAAAGGDARMLEALNEVRMEALKILTSHIGATYVAQEYIRM